MGGVPSGLFSNPTNTTFLTTWPRWSSTKDRAFSRISSGSRITDIRAGLPVEVVFDDVTPEIALAKFQPRMA